jgi:hypothetical protein
MKKPLMIAITLVLVFSTTSKELRAQQGLYLMFGYGVEQYENTRAIDLAVKDYNDFIGSQGLLVEQKLQAPGLFRGALFGMKGVTERMTMSFNINFAQYTSTAKGTDSLFTFEYYKKIKIGNVGVNLNYALNLINAERFRTGPGFSVNIEKFRMYCRDNMAYGTTDYEKPVDKFMLSASLKWPISFGGKKTQFDIIPYYTLPFWKVNATLFNSEELNFGHHTAYTTEQMTINPVRWGVAITFNVHLGGED